MGVVYEARDRELRSGGWRSRRSFTSTRPRSCGSNRSSGRWPTCSTPTSCGCTSSWRTKGSASSSRWSWSGARTSWPMCSPASEHAGGSSDVVSMQLTCRAPQSGVQLRSTPPPDARCGPSGRRTSPADMTGLRPALRQLVEGVQALHSAGKLHRDIKPSNVLVSTEGRVVHPRLRRRHRSAAGRRREPARGGPDGRDRALHGARAGRSTRSRTPASDWYSVGVMLYEALVGSPPFVGSLHQVLKTKNSVDAPAPRRASTVSLRTSTRFARRSSTATPRDGRRVGKSFGGLAPFEAHPRIGRSLLVERQGAGRSGAAARGPARGLRARTNGTSRRRARQRTRRAWASRRCSSTSWMASSSMARPWCFAGAPTSESRCRTRRWTLSSTC